ncbi:MAG: radical SAM family heme chaperone HemW [Candidatus Omnitrophica bacterium]|nr:radical SAM family heme chaperone HemW [Candidatus Omnitrophota bacterium]MDD5311069.1 radical SAM family heme chaperone HemW [Candidatus Omnitrophota bacterium]MDD5546504.1 radical SAM family heme chaperone HemW [Candidatus Omnitrophota bacterium]
MTPSLYIHIPFCAKKCGYCDFYSINYKRGPASVYVDVLGGQMEAIRGPVSTIFIGGGTPTAMDTPLLRKLLRGARRLAAEDAEFTIEANPESLDAGKLDLFLDEGVNRLSIGVQSFNDAKLKRLGRIHSAKKAVDAVMLSRKRGFKNIGIDLIFGAPGETPEDCSAEMARAVKLPVTHVSCYGLTYEKGTPLYKARKKGEVIPADEGSSARMYSLALEYLPAHGFRHYEVSNFAKKGFECRHNLNYWRNGEYIGLGPSAVSYIGGVRKRHLADVREYVKRAEAGKSTVTSSERLTRDRKAKETAAVKIRTAEGIDFGWFKEKTGFDLRELEADALRKLSGTGLIKYKKFAGKGAGVALTKKGFLFCDTVSSELI